jgi:hypothetical protein
VLSCLVRRTADAENSGHRGTYERVQDLRPYRKCRGRRTIEWTVGSGTPKSRGGAHLDSQEGGVSDEFLLRHQRPALGEGLGQPCL